MPQPSLKVNEIFYSIQGEGPHTGMPAVFLRLAGCSMGCAFCDTRYAFSDGQLMPLTDIVQAMEKYPCRNAVITGGEPTEQDFAPLAALLKQRGWCLHMESNGAHDADVSNIDFLVISPKKYVSRQMLQKAHAIKIVIGQETDLQDLQNYFQYANERTAVCLQPQSNLQENIDLCVKLIKQNPFLRLSLQTHKMANIK
ncbi:MAG: 7-carboxy-7-deazaguanine synthase QueE [Elusimicrobiaceae bacterium]|nr:7-carboxy-7-deazaguanine synthase QueE [Elusimicrobiaceae bacterium]